MEHSSGLRVMQHNQEMNLPFLRFQFWTAKFLLTRYRPSNQMIRISQRPARLATQCLAYAVEGGLISASR